MARVGRTRHADLLSAILAATAGLVAAGCGFIPEEYVSDTGMPLRVGRSGLDVHVSVRGWDRAETRMVMCTAPVPDEEMGGVTFAPISRPGCLEMVTERAGLELSGRYSFESASATRRSAFDEAPEWHVILISDDQRADRVIQVAIPGGPVGGP